MRPCALTGESLPAQNAPGQCGLAVFRCGRLGATGQVRAATCEAWPQSHSVVLSTTIDDHRQHPDRHLHQSLRAMRDIAPESERVALFEQKAFLPVPVTD